MWVAEGGGTLIHSEKERGAFPPNPLFQGLLSADLHMKWSLFHSHSVDSPKPATAEALAERGLSQKASNWPVIRLKQRGPAGLVANTEVQERNRWEAWNLLGETWSSSCRWLRIFTGYESEGTLKKNCLLWQSGDRKISGDGASCQGCGNFSTELWHWEDSDSSQCGHQRQWGARFGCYHFKLSSFMNKLFIAPDRQGQSVGGDVACLRALLFPSLKDDLLM